MKIVTSRAIQEETLKGIGHTTIYVRQQHKLVELK